MQIKIHREGWTYFFVSIIFTIISFPFFSRAIPIEEVIVSPADGIITYIGSSKAPELSEDNQELIKISIFLNIFNVHVNRNPSNGVIKKIKYI